MIIKNKIYAIALAASYLFCGYEQSYAMKSSPTRAAETTVTAIPAELNGLNFSWIDDQNHVGGMAFPRTKEVLQALQTLGVKKIVTLTHDEVIPQELLQDTGIANAHIPIPGNRLPTIAEMRDFVTIVQENQGDVIVHCLKGGPRTNVMLAGYLISLGINPEDAIAEMQTRRPGSLTPMGPFTTEAQITLIQAFYDAYTEEETNEEAEEADTETDEGTEEEADEEAKEADKK